MKIIYVSIISLAILLTGCDKDKFLRLPAVETISAEIQGNNVLVTGRITDEGNTESLMLGFFYEKGEEPASILRNQLQIRQVDANGYFTTVIPFLEQDETYYFNTFIVNDQGYTVGKPVKYTIPRFEVPVAPCEEILTMDQIKDNGNIYSVSSASVNTSNTYGFYTLVFDFGYYNPDIEIDFYEKPVTGIYTTSRELDHFGHTYPYTAAMRVAKSAGSYVTGYVPADVSIYVDNIDEDTLIISFCDVSYTYYNPYSHQNVTNVITGKLKVSAED